MARVLATTFPHDFHAVEVALALHDLGHQAVLWHGADFPTRQHASLSFDGEAVGWELSGPEPEIESAGSPFDVVWLRRPTPPALPGDLHPGDLPVAQRENEHFVACLWNLMAEEAFWVNPLSSRGRADLKGVQLREAARAGLEVPPTLMSNDPARIREFLEAHAGGTVFKPFRPAQWDGDGRVALMMTSEVSPADLPSDEMLRLVPGIFQPRIPKAHELRVTYMGGHTVTARLHSQESEATRLDWRAASATVRVEPAILPEEVGRACRRLMERLNLVFGCFDFIVTPEGRHVFLEVNPMGQFLWIEESNPELRLLEPFCEFLAAGQAEFRPKGGLNLRHEDYAPAAEERIEVLARLHVGRVEPYVFTDSPATAEAAAETRDAAPPRGPA